MSYPGYPYQQGSAPGAPFPPQSTPYPSGGPVNPNSFGLSSGTAMYMPQPMPMPAYPTTNSMPMPGLGSGHDYPPSGGSPHPPPRGGSSHPQGNYPSGGGGYPQSAGGYPQSSGGYPQSTGGYPQPTGGYPQSSGGFPQPTGGYPQSSGGYPQPSGGYPQSTGGYPPSGGYSSPYPQMPGAPPAGDHGYSSGGYKGPHGNQYAPDRSSHLGQSYGAPRPKRTPTVVPANPFNARADAEILRKAMKGFGTDEKAIINVLAHRVNAQRLQIAVDFKTLYGKDLISDLKSELSGNFENLVVALMTPLPSFYAKELHDAISGIGTDEDVLIEILCTMSNNEIRTIREAYHAMYFRPLEEDLRSDTSGTFKRMMVSLCTANRDESMATNIQEAQADAQALLTAGELRLGTDESAFNMILCQRNYAQLQLIFQQYGQVAGRDIEDTIKSEFSGDSEEGFLAVVRSIKDQPTFFARQLHRSIKGMGTNDQQLIRVMVTRCEVDMGDIKRAYEAKYGRSLKDDIKDDTTGHYEKCLLALIGEY